MNEPDKIYTELKTYRVEQKCPQEGCTGLMEKTGTGYSNSFETQWEHLCTVCKHREAYGRLYPGIIHK